MTRTPTFLPCPSWCVYEPGHDPHEAADGGRIHRPAMFGDLDNLGDTSAISWDDGGEGWYVEIQQCLSAQTRDEFVAELRDMAADLLVLAQRVGDLEDPAARFGTTQ